MTKKIEQADSNKGVNPMVAVMTGAVIGAGIAVAGAVAMRDEKNSKKVKDALNKAKNQATGYMDDMQKRLQDKKNEGEAKFTEGKEKAEAVKKSVKKSVTALVDDAKKAAE